MITTIFTQVLSSKDFIEQYKKATVRIRKAFDRQFEIFAENPTDLGLRNHPLHGKWQGHRSIDITADWRAVYKEIQEGEELIAYFVALGTHDQLYS